MRVPMPPPRPLQTIFHYMRRPECFQGPRMAGDWERTLHGSSPGDQAERNASAVCGQGRPSPRVDHEYAGLGDAQRVTRKARTDGNYKVGFSNIGSGSGGCTAYQPRAFESVMPGGRVLASGTKLRVTV